MDAFNRVESTHHRKVASAAEIRYYIVSRVLHNCTNSCVVYRHVESGRFGFTVLFVVISERWVRVCRCVEMHRRSQLCVWCVMIFRCHTFVFVLYARVGDESMSGPRRFVRVRENLQRAETALCTCTCLKKMFGRTLGVYDLWGDEWNELDTTVRKPRKTI